MPKTACKNAIEANHRDLVEQYDARLRGLREAYGEAMLELKVCRWTGVSRRSYYYRPTKAKPRGNEHLAARVKRVINDLPYAGYRTVALAAG